MSRKRGCLCWMDTRRRPRETGATRRRRVTRTCCDRPRSPPRAWTTRKASRAKVRCALGCLLSLLSVPLFLFCRSTRAGVTPSRILLFVCGAAHHRYRTVLTRRIRPPLLLSARNRRRRVRFLGLSRSRKAFTQVRMATLGCCIYTTSSCRKAGCFSFLHHL